MQVYAVQPDIAWEDPESNRARIRELLIANKPPPGSLIILPEMYATGFSPDLDKIAEPEDGPNVSFLWQLSVVFQSLVIGGVVNKDETEGIEKPGRNMAACCQWDGSVSFYQKMHSFCLGFEHKDYDPGHTVIVLDYGDVQISPFICYDLRFPEIFRHATIAGAEVLLVIANWPASRDDHWQTLLKARAVENQAWVIGVNRTGNDPDIEYCGNSQIISPRGEIVAHAGTEEGVIHAELDVELVSTVRRAFPCLDDIHRCRLGLSS